MVDRAENHHHPTPTGGFLTSPSSSDKDDPIDRVSTWRLFLRVLFAMLLAFGFVLFVAGVTSIAAHGCREPELWIMLSGVAGMLCYPLFVVVRRLIQRSPDDFRRFPKTTRILPKFIQVTRRLPGVLRSLPKLPEDFPKISEDQLKASEDYRQSIEASSSNKVPLEISYENATIREYSAPFPQCYPSLDKCTVTCICQDEDPPPPYQGPALPLSTVVIVAG